MLFRAHLLSPDASARLLELADGGLVVDDSGHITAMGPFEALHSAHPGERVKDLRPFWILPGLIDLHAHLPQHEAVAMDGLPLLPWLETHIFPAELKFADPDRATRTARAYFQDQLALGTTTSVVYSSVHAEATGRAFQEAEAAGIRAVIGKVMMDRNAPDGLRETTAASLAESEALCREWHGRDHGRLRYAFTPRFAPTCSPELLAGAGALARRHQAYVQTHLSENLQELAWVRELFPESLDYTDVYDQAGLLGPRTLLGHGIHLSPRERRAIQDAGASIVHCPRSNAFLQSGIMALSRWQDEGLSVGLGTDVGAGPSLDMWAEMAMACNGSKLRLAGQQITAAKLQAVPGLDPDLRAQLLQSLDLIPERSLSPAQAFRLATLDGARALGLEACTGSLEVGKEADFIVVDPRRVDPAPERGPEHAEQVLSRLMFRAQPGMVRAAYVRGRPCHAREA